MVHISIDALLIGGLLAMIFGGMCGLAIGLGKMYKLLEKIAESVWTDSELKK